MAYLTGRVWRSPTIACAASPGQGYWDPNASLPKKHSTEHTLASSDEKDSLEIARSKPPLILFYLAYEARRCGDLKRAIGNVSDKMLIQQLKELEADGIVNRRDFKEIPPKVDHSLTAFGQSLARALQPLCTCGTEHMNEVEKLFLDRSAPEVEEVA